MRHSIAITLLAAMTLCGCGTYTGQGAAVGGSFGSMLGSAIGGISGGPRGSDIGTIVGMAGGAAVGAAVGAQADKAQQEQYRQYMEQREGRYRRQQSRSRRQYSQSQQQYAYSGDGSGFDPNNGGDDRITFEPGDGQACYSTVAPRTMCPRSVSVDQLRRAMPGYSVRYNEGIEIRNVSFIDSNGDGILTRGEDSQVAFEIMNRSGVTIYDVQPIVMETTGNKHIHISSPISVESIAPGRGVRYTATIYADSRLKNGNAVIKVAVAQGNREITSQVSEFNVPTRKK